MSHESLALQLERRTSLAGFAVNAAGAASLGALFVLILPPPEGGLFFPPGLELLSIAAFTIATAITASRTAGPWFAAMREWLSGDRPPTDDECRAVLHMPARFARMTALRWALAIPIFGLPQALTSVDVAVQGCVATALAGTSATAAVYLATEWVLRPAFALALGPAVPPDTRSLGIGPRLVLTWLLCSGVPILMIALIPLARHVEDSSDLIAPVLFAAGMALVTGFVATKLATQAVTRPVRELRRAIDAVAEGDLHGTVEVDDGSEIGRAPAGFTAMVGGLREREQLRDLFGRQVGLDVAHAGLENGWRLGGDRCDVTALYIDVIGSTGLAERAAPERVVSLLNDFFAAVVEVVHARGGLVNK